MKKHNLLKLFALTMLLCLTATALIACENVNVKVKFIVDGEQYALIEVNEQNSVAMPADPQKEGYVFDGWYLDYGSWLKPFLGTVPEDVEVDIVLEVYAKWSQSQKPTQCNHFWSDWVVGIEPTCTTKGAKGRYCIKCNKTEAAEIDELGHTEEVIPAVAATCINEGTTEGVKCSICDEVLTAPQTVEKAEHNYESGVCSYCGALDASYGSKGLEFTLNDDGESYSVSGIGTCTDENLIIPVVYDSKPVTRIKARAFENCTSLTSVTIPEGVTSIGNYAFKGCTGLTSVTIPEGVTSIGNCAFDGCTSLTSVTIPDSVTSIEVCAFYDCASLTNVSLGNGVTHLEYGVFSYCESLRYNQYDNALYLGNDENPYVALMEVKNDDITSCTISDGTKIIYGQAFSDCDKLTDVIIPEGVTSIGESAFEHCTGLTSVTIPSSVTSIGLCALKRCSDLTGITVAEDNVNYHSDNNCLIETQTKTLILGCKNSIIPSDGSVTSIGDCAFEDCTGLTSVTIPGSVTYINYGAFSGCTGLTSITIPEGVTSIDNSTFDGCTSLTSVTIPSSVTSIDLQAFEGCTSLTSITIPEGVTYISGEAFEGCKSLTSITIPGSVTYINYSAFSGCTGLTSVTISEGVTSIADGAFSGCTGLTSVTIPSSVTSILGNAFPGCTGLTSITVAEGNVNYHSKNDCLIATQSKTLILGCKNSVIPSDGSVTSIGYRAFSGCSGLTSVTIPNSVTTIGDSAFSGCTGLTSVTIPSSVTSIGRYAFCDTSNLTEINFNGTKQEWDAIKKGNSWRSYSSITKVICSDGTVDL